MSVICRNTLKDQTRKNMERRIQKMYNVIYIIVKKYNEERQNIMNGRSSPCKKRFHASKRAYQLKFSETVKTLHIVIYRHLEYKIV